MRDYVKGKYGELVERIEDKKDLSADDEKALQGRDRGLEEERHAY